MTRQPIAIIDATGPRPPGKAAIRRPRRGIAALRGVQGFRRAVQVDRGALHRVGRDRPGGRGRRGRDRDEPRVDLPVRRHRDHRHVPHGRRLRAPRALVEPGAGHRGPRPRLPRAGRVLRLDLPARLPPGPRGRLQRVRPAARPGGVPRHAGPPAHGGPARGPRPAPATPQVRGARLGHLGDGRLRRHGVPRRRPLDRPAGHRARERRVRDGDPRPDPGRRAVRGPPVVPLRVPAGRCERPRRPVQPGAARALGRRLRGLQPVHQELSHGPAGRHRDRHHLGRLHRLPRVRRGVSRATAPSSSASAFPSVPGHEQGDDHHGPHRNDRARQPSPPDPARRLRAAGHRRLRRRDRDRHGQRHVPDHRTHDSRWGAGRAAGRVRHRDQGLDGDRRRRGRVERAPARSSSPRSTSLPTRRPRPRSRTSRATSSRSRPCATGWRPAEGRPPWRAPGGPARWTDEGAHRPAMLC